MSPRPIFSYHLSRTVSYCLKTTASNFISHCPSSNGSLTAPQRLCLSRLQQNNTTLCITKQTTSAAIISLYLAMSRAIRSLSLGLLSCPVCEVHHEFSLGKLAQHIREHHQQHIYTSSQHDNMQQLGLKSCPTCHLYYSEHSSGFNRHIAQ